MSAYTAADDRYDQMKYRRCGKSGIKLPMISLGLWHNFGRENDFENAREILHYAFDHGITHFDLANNYGPPYGTAEETFGKIMASDFSDYRDEMIISTKAGWDMWPGPYGNWGSRKYLMASLDQSLQRMGLDYVDIFYHHRPDPETPLEETMGALADIVRQGKALYVGVSQYKSHELKLAQEILDQYHIKLLIHQPRYSMMDRWVEEDGLLDTLEQLGIGSIPFSPLEQGLLTDKYLDGIPEDSRVAKDGRYLSENDITDEKVAKVQALNKIAKSRNQTMAQMAVAWLLKDERVTTVLVGVSKVKQLKDNIGSLQNIDFTNDEIGSINKIIKD
ncbi:L-glyceraldehyde 3-phosphate reductase [Portibacter marinus]|uniref:L-glyceraldehyde 3-phosphate reductase n=1 Tax=Portibacter marinus TaxID=2898660 RepID=UPI001F32928F|nr:L-glyceraldehyde 3-phosphate reductase [Portibacter marinus]